MELLSSIFFIFLILWLIKINDNAKGKKGFADDIFSKIFSFISNENSAENQDRIIRMAYFISTKHNDALAKKRQISIRKDAYGNILRKDWDNEILYFISNVINPELDQKHHELRARLSAQIISIVDEVAYKRQCEIERKVDFDPDMSPLDFEHFCASRLRAKGWEAEPTKATGDQGIDIVAKKNGTLMVVQCKLYSQPVGNKAVQEISAGRLHEKAHIACVVTNAEYTKSAKELGNTNNVFLLHYLDLERIDSIVIAN